MTKPFHVVAVTSLLAAASLSVQAGRPLTTDDAGVVEKGHCEIESFLAHATERDSPSAKGASFQLGCGVAGNTQVALQLVTARSGGASARGLAFNGKTALGEAGAGNALAVGWGLIAAQPDGGTMKYEGAFINGIFTKAVDDAMKLHANLGWSRSQTAKQSTTNWGVALERTVAEGFDAMGEVFSNDREKSPWVQVGLRWAVVPEKFFLDTSFGRMTGATRQQQLTVGLKAAF
jgi:hypothetical protein